MLEITNNQLTAKISPHGAELRELIGHAHNINYMWHADPAFWAKTSPVLFPIVGALKSNTYLINNHTYQLPRHGFAREKLFSSEMQNASEVVFTLHSDDETKAIYHFDFVLEIKYSLIENRLQTIYTVKNLSATEMLFSLGAHPAFAVPINHMGSYEDYYLKFNDDSSLTAHLIKDNLIGDQVENISLNDNCLPLKHALFYNDALVFKSLKSTNISLLSNLHKHGINFTFKDFPYFGIWAAPNANFVCLEPWCGIADDVNHNQILSQKEGINFLASGGEFTRSWEVTCF